MIPETWVRESRKILRQNEAYLLGQKLHLILAHTKWTQEKLAKKFKCSSRTIRRYLKVYRELS